MLKELQKISVITILKDIGVWFYNSFLQRVQLISISAKCVLVLQAPCRTASYTANWAN